MAKRGRPKKVRSVGDNGPSEEQILMAVNDLADLAEEKAELNAKIKKTRNQLKQDGFMLHILDRRIRMQGLTPQEQKAEHLTDVMYAKALRQPAGELLDLFEQEEGEGDSLYEARVWRERGKAAGLAGQGWPDEFPDGCPPENQQDWAAGHEEGSEIVRAAYLKRQESVAAPTAASAKPEDAEPEEPTEAEAEFA